MSRLPASGSVLGIDVGYSAQTKTGAACRLDWTTDEVRWTIERFAFERTQRRDVIARVINTRPLLAAALDGPLHPTLEIVAKYRAAERLLTSGFQPRIGKPGQASSLNGIMLNAAASDLARYLLELGACEPSRHKARIHERSIVEAFPTAFLGVMTPGAPRVASLSDALSDRFYVALCEVGLLQELLTTLLPGRRQEDFGHVRDHDDRASLVCAMTALAVAAQDYVAVGDSEGWIVLPPRRFIKAWASEQLSLNSASRDGRVIVEPSASFASGSVVA